MVFVNEVADIVHGITQRYLGSANKNIGDAFLLVWKFLDSDVEVIDGEVQLKKGSTTIAPIADMAVFSFIKMIADINQSKKLAKYRTYEALNARMPNYRVKLGSGIHAGWAIEGALGSEYKIDASYLSPHVNLTMGLEEATKIYGVPFVVSNAYYDLTSKEVQESLRPLDKVTLHGSKEVITIYTFDVDITLLEVDKKKEEEIDKDAQVWKRINSRKLRDKIYAGTVNGTFFVKDQLKKDKSIVKMHSPFTPVLQIIVDNLGIL